MPKGLNSTWAREEAMRNSLFDMNLALKGLHLSHGDIVLLSDVDEILKPELLEQLKYCWGFGQNICFRTNFYYYSYEYNIPTHWTHPQGAMVNTHHEKNTTSAVMAHPLPIANTLRLSTSNQCIHNSGWHCSYCFHDILQFVNKLKSFSHSEFDKEEYTNTESILYRVVNGLDLFNRSDVSIQKVRQEELDAPPYVLHHKNCYAYLTNRSKWQFQVKRSWLMMLKDTIFA
jgi:beta-1,4-mannosyl-glycoprotein beta-1,4-N-acetylglucosaminyltransferase